MDYENQEFGPQEQAPDCQEEQMITPVKTVADKVLPALKDTLFLVICILMSASCILSLSLGNLPLLNILITVFLWLTYAESCKNIADAKHLRCVSGTIFAQYVLTYVGAGLCALLGILFAVAFTFLTQNPELLSRMLDLFVDLDDAAYTVLYSIASVSGFLVLIISLFAAGFIVLVNVFTTRYFHRFVQSVYKSIEANIPELKHTNAARICLYILGGLSALNALTSLGSPLVFLSHAADCAVAFFAAYLIQKYFLSEE